MGYILQFLIFTISFFLTSCAKKQVLKLATTTSIYDSGLLDVITNRFENKYKCKVKVLPVGTGQALKIASNGDVDCVITHDQLLEEKFMSDGYGALRKTILTNNFVIVGPKTDPAGIKTAKDAFDAFRKIANSGEKFVSRADDSGTHKKEISIWTKIQKKPLKKNYIQAGCGMISTLRIANEKSAYCLTDKATFIVHNKELKELEILFSNSKFLFNPYSFIIVSPKKFKHTNYQLSLKFLEFLQTKEIKNIIKNFGNGKLFVPS